MSDPCTVVDVIEAMEAHYPPELAEDWDRIGLVCGDPSTQVRRVLLVVDVTDDTVNQAVVTGADVLIAHHPLLLRGVHSVATTTPKGRLLHKLIAANVALYVAHTNADSANPGVSDALAEVLGLSPRSLAPLQQVESVPLDKFSTTVPPQHAQRVLDALCLAGAGWGGGEYQRCAFFAEGTGTFVPSAAANPAVGERGRINLVPELRLDTVMPRSRRGEVIQALHTSHPYEEPAFDVIELAPRATDTGLGRVGDLCAPVSLRAFAAQVAAELPSTPVGVRAAGNPARDIIRVAVAGGAGDGLLSAAAAAGADVFVTADLRHHVVSEFMSTGMEGDAPALIDAGHWATERPWLDQAARLLRAHCGEAVRIEVSNLVTDPWTVRMP